MGQGKAVNGSVKGIFMKRTIFLDGQYLKVNGQMVEAFTPGVFQAQGVFETMLGLEGAVLDIDLHLKRLR